MNSTYGTSSVVTATAVVVQITNCTAVPVNTTCTTAAEYIIYMYVFTVISYAGIILNILNLIIFTRPNFRMSRTTLTFLTALAVFDLGYLTTAGSIGIIRCVPIRIWWETYVRSYYEVYVYLPICNAFASASVFLLVVISIERFASIRQLTSTRPAWGRRKSVATVLLCFVGGLAMAAPYFFYKEVDADGRMVYTEYGQSDGFAHYSWTRLILNKFVPITIIVIFNGLLVGAVVRSRRQTKANGLPDAISVRRRRQQTRLTVMMISISCVLTVCHSLEPFAHGGLYKALFGPCSIYTTSYEIVRVVANTLETLSFSSNFVFYCLFNGEFLKTLRVVLCCCLSKRIRPVNDDNDAGETSVNVISKKEEVDADERGASYII